MLRVQVAADARMGLDVEEYVASFRPDLADAVFQWCRGASFAKIAKLSHVFEARTSTSPSWIPTHCQGAAAPAFCTLPDELANKCLWGKRAIQHLYREEQGSLVRAVRRVEEVLRQAAAGAAIMGEAGLVELFQQGSAQVKRDVVFAASLYL